MFNTQKEAISYGKEIAKNQNSELVIHNKHSKIHEVVYIQLLILRLLSDSTSRWTPLSFANSLPLSCSIRDFHPQVVAHAGHTKNKKKPNWLLFVLYTSCGFFPFFENNFSLFVNRGTDRISSEVPSAISNRTFTGTPNAFLISVMFEMCLLWLSGHFAVLYHYYLLFVKKKLIHSFHSCSHSTISMSTTTTFLLWTICN